MDLESKVADKIKIHFTDKSSVTVEGFTAAYIYLHLKQATDLLPLLYRSNGQYDDGDMKIPIATLLEEEYVEPRTR